ncbi:sensor histidine kinase [Nesterenkonia sp. K-15-9-6]|uniref:sensor histidine kinase n=1 Tax=Nesterenkonia sp. K-15-9-6 TaxID=3093918 RepID=UPI004044E251
MLRPDEHPRAGRGVVILRSLRVGLHTSVAVLLVIGLIRLLDGPHSVEIRVTGAALTLVFAAVYVAGTFVERRVSEAKTSASSSTGPLRTDSALGQGGTLVWLFVVTGLWGGLLTVSADFAWVAFPLFFLHLHLLRVPWAVVAVAGLTGAVVLALWNQPGGDHPATVIGPIIGAVCAGLMAQAYRIMDQENRALRETMEDLQRARQELVAAQREAGALVERERLAREIHDTLAQGLASIVLMSRAAGSNLDSGSVEQARDQLSTVVRTAGENLDEARRFVAVLQSGELQDPGLLDELRRACRQIEAQAAAQGQGLRCRLRVSGGLRPVAGSQAMLVLRAVQATLANVLRHAQADTAAVTLTFLQEALLVDVVDDGVGFDQHATVGVPPASGAERPMGTGVGLGALRDRVAAQGGQLHVESSPGSGTAVSIRIPLGQEPPQPQELPGEVERWTE